MNFLFYFVLFCCERASELSEGENEQMRIIVCRVVTYTGLHMLNPPPGPKLIYMKHKEYTCLHAAPLRVF